MQKTSIFSEEYTEFFRDRKNDVPMLTVDQFQSDVVSPIRLVCNTASIAKTRMTTKRDKFVSTAAIALIKAAPIIRIPAIDDACDLFQDDRTDQRISELKRIPMVL